MPPPIEDGAPPRLDVSFDADVSPPTIDVEIPRPDIASDVTLPPPPDGPTGCPATGPFLSVVRVNGRNSEACAGQVAAHTFTHALCACGDLSLGQGLQTGSFDSMAADRTLVLGGAPVGVRGNYPAIGARIGGSLTVAGTTPLMAQVSGALDVNGDLRLAGAATFGYLTIERDAWIASKAGYVAVATVGRTLYYVPPGGLFGLIPVYAAMKIPVTSITVADPCRCDERLDIATMEKAGASKADNADRAALVNVTTPITRELPCGHFRFDSIGGTAAIQVKVTGRSAIFVDGNVTASDLFQLVLAPGFEAEVDLFIGGNLTVGAAKIGDLTRPSATRIYVAGSNDIQLSSELIGANIYAPNANVSIAVGSLAGSVHAKNLSVPSGGFVKYDRAILHQGDKCEQPATCDKCYSCNAGAACIDTTCGTCTKDDDCCLPLVCTEGLCQQLRR